MKNDIELDPETDIIHVFIPEPIVDRLIADRLPRMTDEEHERNQSILDGLTGLGTDHANRRTIRKVIATSCGPKV